MKLKFVSHLRTSHRQDFSRVCKVLIKFTKNKQLLNRNFISNLYIFSIAFIRSNILHYNCLKLNRRKFHSTAINRFQTIEICIV